MKRGYARLTKPMVRENGALRVASRDERVPKVVATDKPRQVSFRAAS